MSDHRTLLSGTALNIVGLAAGVAAAFGVQVLMGRHLGRPGLGVVTVAVQVAFVAAAGSRFGMDLSAVRDVAIRRGADRLATLRSLVERCTAIAFGVSVAAAVAIGAVAIVAGDREIAIAAASVPLAAAANVYLGATRGLKAMAPTLWVFWIGQPLTWILLAGAAFAAGGGIDAAVWCYDASWLLGAIAARALWRSASAGFGDRPATPEEVRAAVRFGLPRAPSALLAQALFWADLWVVGGYVSDAQVGTYAAVGRISQVLLLFLTSVNLLFSPFAADLHARGMREELDSLFKSATRWALAATVPVVIILWVGAADVLAAFGPRYQGGEDALRILLAGQLVNVATGSVAFVLIMVGRTGLDLVDNVVAVAVLVALAAPLSSAYGIEGAAIASAVAIGGVNLLRLVQVARTVGIQPYTGDYGRLLLPAAGCLTAALLAHAATSSDAWFVALLATGAAAGAVYLVLLPAGLPPGEREALYRSTRRITNRGPR
ncbi:MAG TPA: oligosaccharide flippase family protein [Gaiellales bacterium]